MKDSLRLKVSLGIAAILAIFLFFLGAYMVESQREQLLDNLRDHGERIASLAARSSAEYIQRFSYFLMEDQALSIEKSPQVAFCEIYDANGVSLLQSGDIISKDHSVKQKPRYGNDIMVVSQPITSGDRTLGRVEIGLMLDEVHAAMREKTVGLCVIFLGFLIAVVLAINLFLQGAVVRPVMLLADMTRRVSGKEFARINLGPRKDELGVLACNFNEMSRALEGLYRNLEEKVEERTRELAEANRQLVASVERTREMAIRAEEGVLAKSQFLASMSHEIRTPIHAVLGMAEALGQSPLNPKQRSCLDALQASGTSLLDIINDILDLSRIEAGEIVFKQDPFDLCELVSRSFKAAARAGGEKELELACSLASNVPHLLIGDAPRLNQILINLLGNSVKFTEKGSVTLDVVLDKELPGGGKPQTGETIRLRFRVKDTGIGVSPEKLAAVFERFTQADASTTRKYGGTGLGLSIARLLCEKMGGAIWIESVPGRGTSVFFTLPFVVEREPLASLARNARLAGTRLLVIEDFMEARDAASDALRRVGAYVETAGDFSRGKALAKKAAEGEDPFDMILLDGSLPGTTFEDCVKELVAVRVDPRSILLLASAGMVRDMLTAESVGGFILKPACIRDIAAAYQVMRDGEPEGNPADGEAGADVPSRRIKALLVEDSPPNQALFKLFTEKTACEVHVANDGAEGVDMFTRGVFDIVFMDIEMPGMDGYESARRIREWEKAQGRPATRIVALTAHAMVETRERILAAGCDDVLTKPFSQKIILAELRYIAASPNG